MEGVHKIRVMGIDPGLAHTGYGVVALNGGGRLEHISNGTISTSSRTPLVERLSKIHRELDNVITDLQPHHVAVEQVFFSRNPKSALLLGHARGVAILSAAMSEIRVFEYSATETKKAVCNYGRGGKEQVNAMVKVLLGLRQDLSEHASDALALCICHVHSHRTVQARALAVNQQSGRTQPREGRQRKGKGLL